MSSSDSPSNAGDTVKTSDSPQDVALGRTVVPVVNRNKLPQKDKLGFEYAEHCFIGDSITLTLANGQKVAASDYKFHLNDGVVLTYGQINGLAGDFYGTFDPISDGKNQQEQSQRFERAYYTLANGGSRQPKEAEDILAILQAEVDAVNKALANHEDPSTVYPKLPNVDAKLQLITLTRPKDIPSYLGLAKINWDHFGADARTAYNAGHATAILKAINGDLDGAYAMNAFADHFLEDSFAAGHLRTPRRLLHNWELTADRCAKFMHDEDNAIGISVKNPAGESWTAYGDKRALDSVDEHNKNQCVDAVQASADEIYTAYLTRQLPPNYRAWTYAPTLESAAGPQTLARLFTFKNERRKIIKNRKLWDFKTDWWFATTATECQLSGWWNYPITIDGPKVVIPWSAIAVTAPKLQHISVFYQGPDGAILESHGSDGSWASGRPIFNAVLFTPLAVINWNAGKEIRVYYLDEQYILQDYCYSGDQGSWSAGELGAMKIQAAYNTSIAAIQYVDDQGGVHIRVYCQESGSDAIKEFCNDGHWFRGSVLPLALSGSSLTAVAYWSKGLEIRLYYQVEDLSLKEHCLSETEWYPGKFNVGKAPGCVTISAIGWYDQDPEVHVFWRNLESEIVGTKNTGSQWGSVGKVVGDLKPGTQFAVAHWGNGTSKRLYYQSVDSIHEMYNDLGEWVPGETITPPGAQKWF